MTPQRGGAGKRGAAVGFALLIAAIVLVAAGCGGSNKSASPPKFSAGDLSETAGDNWPTNGGSTMNQRYSSLDEIDDSNIGQVKGVWLKHLDKSGTAAKYS